MLGRRVAFRHGSSGVPRSVLSTRVHVHTASEDGGQGSCATFPVQCMRTPFHDRHDPDAWPQDVPCDVPVGRWDASASGIDPDYAMHAAGDSRVARVPGPGADHPGCRPSGGGQVAALGVVVTAQPVDDADDAGRVVEVAPPLDGADDSSPDGGRRVRRRREHATIECSPFQLPGDERRLDLAGGSEPHSGAGTRLAASELEFRGRP